jgi:serine O-acetyltransferase
MIFGSRSGARPKAPAPAIRFLAALSRRRFLITPISQARCPGKSVSGSEKPQPSAGNLPMSPARPFGHRPIWSTRRAATSRRSRFRIRHHRTSAAASELQGYVALQAWRVSNWLWRQTRIDLALLLQSLSSDSLQVSIHPSASIGTSVFLDHATGIIVGSFVVIGDEVTIYQNVTIGRKDTTPGRAPRIGRGVLLSSGATILGDINVGDFARIGAGSVVTSDVPAGCTAVGVPARLTNCPGQLISA